ncbi:MAG: ribulose-bisphosphate carboxylase [Patescibacteria group bacterium]
MQKAYLKLDLTNPQNGQYMLAVFHLVPESGDLLSAATEVAAESSTGSNLEVGTATEFSHSLDALVYKVDEQKNLVWIAYPWRLFDRGGNIQNILTYVVGNVFGMKEAKALKLLDVWFPQEMLEQYDGPACNIDNLRKYLNVYGRPILGTIIKPKMGLTASQYAEVCYDFWSGDGDFVKNDEPQADQDFCPYEQMVKGVKQAMDKAVKETGHKKIHSFNISAADFDTMIKRAELIKNTFEPGSYAFLVDGITAGWTAVQTIRRHYPDVFLHFHRAMHGAFTREENPIGFTNLVLAKFARLAGASGIHVGTSGVGKMAGSPDEDLVASHALLKFKSEGYFFSQEWGKISRVDEDLARIETEDGVKKSTPILSGGLNPTKLKAIIDIMGTVDFITTMGAGVHAHPDGTKAGAMAVLQACEAYQKNIDINEYAKDHKELTRAIEFFGATDKTIDNNQP